MTLIKVFWYEDLRTWEVIARPDRDSDWSTFEGGESELDTLLSLARDVVTGG